MNIHSLVAAGVFTVSALVGIPAAEAATDASVGTNLDASTRIINPVGLTDSNLDVANDEVLLANHEPFILISNESSMEMAYDLDGISYRLAPGMWRQHFFTSYGDGDLYIDFDYSTRAGWQNETYNLRLNSSFKFRNRSWGVVDLFES